MEDIGRSTNTAVAEPQSKVHAMDLTHGAARPQHPNTDVRLTSEDEWLSPVDQ